LDVNGNANDKVTIQQLASGDYRQAKERFGNVLASPAGERELERCGLPFFPVPACNVTLTARLERGIRSFV
jgi:hypothetical protein